MSGRIAWVVVGLIVVGLVGYLGWRWWSNQPAQLAASRAAVPPLPDNTPMQAVQGAGLRIAGPSPEHMQIANAASEISLIP